MNATSTWTALRNPVFRKLWLAGVASGCCVAAHDMAATWVMNTLSPSPVLLSLLSTAASLPFFLLTFPAGALADVVDRKKLLCVMHLWLAAVAGSLAVLGWLHLLSPGVILAAVFLLGVGFACNAPAWSSVTPEVVTKDELPSAVTLSGVQMNLSGILGPALGGLLLPWLGVNALFALNAAAFLLVLAALQGWRPARKTSQVPVERLFESFVGAIRYVRYSPGMQVVLARAFLFALLISVIPALLPVVGLQALHLSAARLGILFTSMGVGSLAGAVWVIPWARARYAPNQVTILASGLLAAVYFLMVVVRNLEAFMAVAALAGLGWTLAASELWVAAQRAMPGWTRGRLNAAQIMVSQGGITLGGIVWGALAAFTGFEYALWFAVLLVCLNLSLAGPLSIDFTGALDLELATPPPEPDFPAPPSLEDGPITLVIELVIRPQHRQEFLVLMRELQLAFLRNGASSVRLHEQLEKPSVFRLEVVTPTWREHLRMKERLTKVERDALDRALSLNGAPKAAVGHYALVTWELLAAGSPRPENVPSD